MAPKALPALVLLALICGELAIDCHAQTYIGGTSGRSPAGMQPLPYASGGSPAGMQPPSYTSTRGGSHAGYDDGTGRLSPVREEKAFMFNGLPARELPIPVPPTSN